MKRPATKYGITVRRFPHHTDEHWEHVKLGLFRDLAMTLAKITTAGFATPIQIERYETPEMLRVALLTYENEPLPERLIAIMTQVEPSVPHPRPDNRA